MTDSPDPDAQADGELLRRAAAGDAAACRRLVHGHLPALVGFAYRLLGDRAEAEDIAQEAMLRLWRQAASWKPRARLAAWLHRVAYNLAVDRLRARGRLVAGDPPDRPDPADGPVTALHKRQVAAAVEAALADLPERQRAAIALVHYQGFGNAEAAGVLGVSVEALESLLARGRRALRARLLDRRDELLGED